MEKYYKTSKIITIITAILMVVLFVVALFLGDSASAITSLGIGLFAIVQMFDLNLAETWYTLMNRYRDLSETQEKVIDVYKKMDSISSNALKIAEECNKDNHTYLDALSEMNKLTNFFLDGIDDEAALAANEEMKDTNMYLRKIDLGKWVLCCRKPW